jgi:hypothetical protein
MGINGHFPAVVFLNYQKAPAMTKPQAHTKHRSASQNARQRARKAFEIVKVHSPALIGTRPHLYKKCLDGITVFEELRQRGIPKSDEPFEYGSLGGQQIAHLITEATLDNVLTILIEETPEHKWSWDMVVDNGLILGSRITEPFASREEAEEAALHSLGVLGQSAEPAAGYVPEASPDNKLQIRVNGITYICNEFPDDPRIGEGLTAAMEAARTTYEEFLANLANLVLADGAESHTVALTILANCRWTHLSPQILEDFCTAHGIDLNQPPPIPNTPFAGTHSIH